VRVKSLDAIGLPDFIRVSVGAPDQNARFADALQEALSQRCGGSRRRRPFRRPNGARGHAHELAQLRIFCAIAQSKTLTQAAQTTRAGPATLSQQLSRLEEKVGTKLFDRSLNQMELTVAGQFLLRRALHILDEVEGAQGQMREFAAGKRGIIRLAGINSIIRVVVPQAILLLKQRLPRWSSTFTNWRRPKCWNCFMRVRLISV